MAKPQNKPGRCVARGIEVTEQSLCDYFETKRKKRYRVRCKNCVHFVNSGVELKDKTNAKNQSKSE